MAYYIDGSDTACFKLIKSVLDEMYDKLPGNNEYKDATIEDRLINLWADYRKLKDGLIPQYSDLYTCFAYLYCFVSAHANIVCELINLSPELNEVFNADELRVSCLGGGPASDLLGILKFMRRGKKRATLHCDIYDKQAIWKEFWNLICKEYHSPPVQTYSSFQLLDITTSEDWSSYPKLWNSDLIMMSFFMSEVYPIRDTADKFFKRTFEQAKSGSSFLFVDNISVGAESWFDSLVESHNRARKQGRIEVINTSDQCYLQRHSFQMENLERKEDLEPYFGRYYNERGRVSQPRLTADVVFRICRKR